MEGPRILVASDGSEPVVQACRALTALALTRPGEIRLLTVLSYADLPVDEESGEPSDPLYPARAIVEQAVGEVRRVLEPSGCAVTVRTRLGDPAEQILAEVDEWAPHLLVLGRRRLTAIEQRLLGSVSEQVIRGVRVPVLMSS